MLRYELPGYRPAGIQVPRPALGQVSGIRAAVGVSSLLVTALGAGTVYVGLRAGERDRGFRKVLGYAVAVFGAFVTLSGVGGIAGTLLGNPIKESFQA